VTSSAALPSATVEYPVKKRMLACFIVITALIPLDLSSLFKDSFRSRYSRRLPWSMAALGFAAPSYQAGGFVT
jgi:hypothetical protein